MPYRPLENSTALCVRCSAIGATPCRNCQQPHCDDHKSDSRCAPCEEEINSIAISRSKRVAGDVTWISIVLVGVVSVFGCAWLGETGVPGVLTFILFVMLPFLAVIFPDALVPGLIRDFRVKLADHPIEGKVRRSRGNVPT